jgi:hypothetical protein
MIHPSHRYRAGYVVTTPSTPAREGAIAVVNLEAGRQTLGAGTTPENAPEAVGSPQTSESEPHGFWDRVRRFWSG